MSAGGAPFRFQSVDLYSSVTTIPYVITGILNSTTVFVAQATLGNTFGAFVTVQNPQSTTVVDSLVIRLSNSVAGNPMGLDNIKLSF